VPATKFTKEQHLQYLNMLGVVGTRWQHVLLGLPEYQNSNGWGLLTNLWSQGRVKMSTAYSYMKELKSPTTQRSFILNAIKAGLVLCDDRDLMLELTGHKGDQQALEKRRALERRKNGRPGNSRRGLSSPEIWLSQELREKLDIFFDEAIDELVKAAEGITAHTTTSAGAVQSAA
jgi:hypothetical protein